MTIFEGELDLRPYLWALIRHWWKIALLGLLAAVVAFVYTRQQPPEYKSTATILLTRSRTKLSLTAQFPTVEDPTDIVSRMNAILTIAQDDSVAMSTLQSLRVTDTNTMDVDAIKKMVEISNKGDAILVTATSSDQTQAAEVANTWARETVRIINQALSGEQPLDEIRNQIEISKVEYEKAQSNLENFIQNNKIYVLENEVGETKKLLSVLSSDRVWKISFQQHRKQEMESIIAQAEALKLQLESGSQSNAGDLGDALAVLITRSTVLGIVPPTFAQTNLTDNPESSTQPLSVAGHRYNINIVLPEINTLLENKTGFSADLETIITQAVVEKEKSELALKTLAQEFLSQQEDDLIEETALAISDLEKRLEQQISLLQELTNERDISRRALSILLEKETEIISAPRVNDEIKLAGLAIPPVSASPRKTIQNTVIAGVLGILLGITAVIIREWWQNSVLMPSPANPQIQYAEMRDK